MVCSPETLFRRSGVRRLPMRAGPEHTRLPGVRGEEGGGRGDLSCGYTYVDTSAGSNEAGEPFKREPGLSVGRFKLFGI